MLKVGITGGIGSGKSTACRIFETLNIPIYYADERAKWLMTNDEILIQQIKSIFGPEAYLENGQLNREHIAKYAFNDVTILKKLNSVVHPAVEQDASAWFETQTDTPYTLQEAALFFETGRFSSMDKIITVTSPIPIRITRVMARDGVSREAVEARMENQLPESEKVKRSHFVIYNDGERALIPQVLEIHRALLREVDMERRTFF